MTQILEELRFGIRFLVKRPGASALCVIALAVGIGLTTTTFSIVYGIVLRGLPFEQSNRILYVGAFDRTKPGRPGRLIVHDYLDIRAAQRSFDIAGYAETEVDLVGGDGVPLRYEAARLTPDAFQVLRAGPSRGRAFTLSDAEPGAPKVAIIGADVWSAQFQRAEDIVGRVARLNGEQTTIVGVMPEWFGFPHSASVWLPLTLEAPAKRAEGIGGEAFGRLREGVSIDQANAELATLAASLEQQHAENKNRSIAAITLINRLLPSRIFPMLATMLAAVFLVLLIACVNVANLQLARMIDRAKDVAIRLALGASNARIVRELIWEGLLLAMAGAVLGVALARIGVDAVARGIDDPSKPFWIVFRVDAAALLFTSALMVVAALASAIIPALRVTRATLAPALNDDSRATTGRRAGRFSRVLVMAQIALSCALLLPSGLMVRTIAGLAAISFPYRTDVLAARLAFSAPAYKDDATLRQAMERIRTRVAAIPNVAEAAFSNRQPGFGATSPISTEAVPAAGGAPPRAEVLQIDPSYLPVMRLRVTRGRALGALDRAGGELVALVSDDFAQQFFDGRDPIGQRIQLGAPYKPAGWPTIVGVVPRLPNVTRDGVSPPTIMVAIDQMPTRGIDLVVAARGSAIAPAMAVRKAVAEIDPGIVVSDVGTVQDRFDQRTWPFRVFGGLFSVFGVAALLLAGAGLYGVMASAVGRRTGEIGIRMAPGADRPGIVRMVLREGAFLVTIGVLFGGGLAILLAAQLTQLLFRVRPWDPLVVAATVFVLCAAGALASWIPARRAASVDPLVALRQT